MRIAKVIRDKQGNNYVLLCCLIVASCLILSVTLNFITSMDILVYTRENSKVCLDSYITKNSIQIFDSIKQSSDYIDELVEDGYLEMVEDQLSLVKKDSMYYSYTEAGDIRFYMTIPDIEFKYDNSLSIAVEYNQYIPIRFIGGYTIYAEIPVKIESEYNNKF